MIRCLFDTPTFILTFALGLAPGLPSARAESDYGTSAIDELTMNSLNVDGARLAATVAFHRLYEMVGPGESTPAPALAYDILFDTNHQRLRRRQYQTSNGDLLWAQVPPRTGGRPLLPVARVLAQNPARAALISLRRIPASAVLGILRVRSMGRDVLVIDGLDDATKGGPVERALVEESFETFLREFLTDGTTVIVADESRHWREVGSSLSRLSTGFPDGTSIFDASDCELRLTVQ